MSCNLIPNSFDRSSYLLFVLGEEIRIFLILRRFMNVEYTKRQLLGSRIVKYYALRC